MTRQIDHPTVIKITINMSGNITKRNPEGTVDTNINVIEIKHGNFRIPNSKLVAKWVIFEVPKDHIIMAVYRIQDM